MTETEVALAVADETCQSGLEYGVMRRAVQYEYESAFVTEKADDIAYLRELFAGEH